MDGEEGTMKNIVLRTLDIIAVMLFLLGVMSIESMTPAVWAMVLAPLGYGALRATAEGDLA